jgi:hypothetical protein
MIKCKNKGCSLYSRLRKNHCVLISQKLDISKYCECYKDDYGDTDKKPRGEPAWITNIK